MAKVGRKLTRWYPSTVLPVRSGFYQRIGPSKLIFYYYFDSSKGYWLLGGWTVLRNAVKNQHHNGSRTSSPDMKWRGILKTK